MKHQLKFNEKIIFENAQERIENLLKLQRYREAAEVADKLGGIFRLWAGMKQEKQTTER